MTCDALRIVAALLGVLGQEPKAETRYEVLAPKPGGLIVEAINARGDAIGFEWVEQDNSGIVEQLPFYAEAGGAFVHLPLLEGYTATHPRGVSDDGTVVGRSSKPAPPGVIVPKRNQAFVWDARRGIRGLGVPEGDRTSFATGISGDGRRIAGYLVGQDRKRACVWDRVEGADEGDEPKRWHVTILPLETDLGGDAVAMSRDGRRVAALDGAQAVLWTLDEAGGWRREPIGGPGEFVPRAVNDAGTVVGLRHFPDGNPRATLRTPEGELREVPLPEGYERAEAIAVNNAGVVVGMIDGPRGGLVGPNAFVLEPGAERPRILSEGGPGFASATAINDRNQVAGVVETDEP